MKYILEKKYKWGIDTNIFVYLLNKSSKFNNKTENLFDYIQKNKIQIYTTDLCVLEVLHILRLKFDIPYKDCIHQFSNLANLIGLQIVMPNFITLSNTSKTLYKLGKKRICYDIYITNTFKTNDINHIITANEKDFKLDEEIAIYNPFVS